MDREQNGFIFNHDLPHENTMDDLGLELNDLSASLRAKVRQFDNLFAKALADGYVDDREEEELIAESYKISLLIEEEHKQSSDGASGLGILGGILLLFGAAIGIKELTK